MADNVTITVGENSTPPDGTVVAADEIGGVQYQRIKVALGADGAHDTDLDSGQQIAANSMPVVLASDQPALSVAKADAVNTYGENSSVPSGNTVALVTFAAPASWKFTGFLAGGEVDGRFFVQFGGTTKYVARTNIAQRQVDLVLPNPDADGGGVTVTIQVENTGEVTGAYEATLLGA